MNIDESDIDAEVYSHDKKNDRYYLKVIFNSIGMYINSFAVMPSKFENHEYWVVPPKHFQNGRWTGTVDFDKTAYPTWNIIEAKCLQAVKDANGEEQRLAKLSSTKRKKDDDPINLDDIPF